MNDTWSDANKVVDDNAYTPLHCAANNPHTSASVVQLLLQIWPESIRILDYHGQQAPFHCAILNHENPLLDVIYVLLRNWPEVISLHE